MIYIVFLFLFTFVPYNIEAIIPLECTNNATTPDKVCCPINKHNGMVCGGPHRGKCQKLKTYDEPFPIVFLVDDRLNWPTRFIKHACHCDSHFWGKSCEQCWFGWTGPDCQIKAYRVRRDIRTYSPDELKIFQDVIVRSLKWPSGYAVLDESNNMRSDPINHPRFIPVSMQYYLTFLHAYGSRNTLYEDDKMCDEYGVLDFNHDGVGFPTWHRYFSLIWERLLGQIAFKIHKVDDFTLPYWDWVGMLHCDICTNEYIGAPGPMTRHGMLLHPGSPFHNMTDFCWIPSTEDDEGCFGCQRFQPFHKVTRRFIPEPFPNQDDVEFILSRKKYFVSGERDAKSCDSFHMALEGFCGCPGTGTELLWTHNRVHNMIEGCMQSTITATNDPIFILHHNFLDKLFSMWYRRHKPRMNEYPDKHVRPGHSRRSFIASIFPVVRNEDMFTDVEDLGYDYDDPYIVGMHAQNGREPVFCFPDFP